ncbi:NF-kappa-B inhibitor alpha-like isoform X2 [Physella acuta]|uniref:NF-kappa-B inhibitor alpha-like isoform X2 n=1 Tax=Physella acuta TaxID=109671 RepID=UPI0027DAC067|nr:NF-kappa-B inhibitor alpha-like isoform X2 [Physella acuta]
MNVITATRKCTDILKTMCSLIEERIDSGLGSLGYVSSDTSNLSIAEEPVTDNTASRSRSVEKNTVDLSHQLSLISIDSLKENCDSGVDENFISNLRSPDSQVLENWSSPSFSAEQIVEIFRGDEDGDNHLHLSIIHGLPEVTMQIIGLAPDLDWLNQTNSLLQTPLHIAVITGQTCVVGRLMAAGAALDVRDQLGNTPLHNACRLGFTDIVRTLITPGHYEETLQNQYGIPNQQFPQDLELKNYEGLTCLHLAAIGEHVDVMQLLLAAGADVNQPEGKSGRSVLHLAAEWGNLNMLRFLLSFQETHIDAQTYAGLTPILLAVGRKHEDIVKELFKHGALLERLSLSDDSDISDDEMNGDASEYRTFGLYQPKLCQNTCG